MPEPQDSPLQSAIKALTASVGLTVGEPSQLILAAYVNGIITSARLQGLINAMARMHTPAGPNATWDWPSLYESETIAALNQMSENIRATIATQPKIQVPGRLNGAH